MKKLAIFLIIPALFFSCSEGINPTAVEEKKAEEENNIDSPVGVSINLSVLVAVVDEDYNDLLNPQLPNYLGDEYTNGIEVLYLVNGEKVPFLDYYQTLGGGETYIIDDVENIKTISPPYRYVPGYGEIKVGTLGNYFINCTNMIPVDVTSWVNQAVSLTYIRYPNGNEDEIKVEIYQTEPATVTQKGKLWVNGELAFDLMSRYYNPKYFPYLKPVLDDDGNQIEDWKMPETAEFLVWLIK